MARAKAAPDPAVLEYTRRNPPTLSFLIEAYRDGRFVISLNGAVVQVRAQQLGAYFGAPRFPSNRFQAETIRDAKHAIDAIPADKLLKE